MWRSIAAVVAGIAALTVTSFAIEWLANPLMERSLPPDTVRIVTALYGLVCVGFGGWVCARIGRRAPLGHGWAMGIAQAGMTMLAMISFSGLASTTQWVLTALAAIPASAAGAWVFARGNR